MWRTSASYNLLSSDLCSNLTLVPSRLAYAADLSVAPADSVTSLSVRRLDYKSSVTSFTSVLRPLVCFDKLEGNPEVATPLGRG